MGGVADLYLPKRRPDEGHKKMGVIGGVRDPRHAMNGMPPFPGAGMGCVLTPTPQQLQRRRPLATGPLYPYPLHIPRAAAAAAAAPPQQQPQQIIFTQAEAAIPTTTPMDRIMSIASGIGCTIALLFMWIFRYEVLKFGVLFGVLGILWMAGRWYGQVNVLQREHELVREGRLYAGQVQPQQMQPQQMQQMQPQQMQPQQYQQQQPRAVYVQQQQPEQQRYVITGGPFPGRPVPGGL